MKKQHQLSNLAVVVTRASHQLKSFSAQLQGYGFSVLEIPLLAIEKMPCDPQRAKLLSQLEQAEYSWLIFTSANGVRFFNELQTEASVVLKPQQKVAALGKATAEIFSRLYSRPVDMLPSKAVSDDFLVELLELKLEGKRVLLVLASQTRDVLRQGLIEAGVDVEVLIAYQTVQRQPARQELEMLSGYDPANLIFPFFSPSAFLSALKAFSGRQEILRQARIAAIGPVTSEAVKAAGYNVFVESLDQDEASFAAVLADRAAEIL